MRRLARRSFDLLALFQLGDDAVYFVILVSRFLAGARDDQWRTGLIDKDRIDFIDDGVVMSALHAVFKVELHVVAQIIEAELIVGAVCDVGGVCGAAFFIIEIMHDHTDGQAEKTIELAHPFRVAFGQIVVDRNHVHTAAAKGIEIDRQCGNQGFAFAGLHFGDSTLVQHHATDQLHIEVTHVEHAASGFAHHGESFGKNFVEDFL